jgi:hypothetical protein
MPNELFSRVVVGVGSAVVLAALALIWNGVTNGGLVRGMGGVTPDQLATSGVIPKEAVLAFDLDRSKPIDCPDGWRPYHELGGRMIVGAGEHTNRDELGAAISNFAIGASGGSEKHALTLEEMPAHDHEYTTKQDDRIQSGTNTPVWWKEKPARTSITGGLTDGTTKPHNNMPPFLALMYCIQE